MIIRKKGNIFTTKAQTIVNTVNCVGVMGAGIAFEFRLRSPDMYESYRSLCKQKQMDIGKLWIYAEKNEKSAYDKVLNFPTKFDWKYPTKEEYLVKGLEKFIATYKERGITSIAFPLLGADKGGLGKERSLRIMEKYLSSCDIDVEIWEFDPMARDDLYDEFKNIFQTLDDEKIKAESKIRIDIVRKVRAALESDKVYSLSGLLRVKGIGTATLEKLFRYIKLSQEKPPSLFGDAL